METHPNNVVVDTSYPDMTTETIHGEKFLLERAIETMECERRCVHPVHRHAFRQVNMITSLLSGTAMRKCEGCQGRLRSLLSLERDDAHQQIVKCVTCGVVAHRHCALSRTTPWQGSPCRGPEPAVTKKRRKSTTTEYQHEGSSFAAVAAVGGCYHVDETAVCHNPDRTIIANLNNNNNSTDKQQQDSSTPLPPPKSLFPFLSATSLLKTTRDVDDATPRCDDINCVLSENAAHPLSTTTADVSVGPRNDRRIITDDDYQDSEPQQNMTWTPDGPPPHWAAPSQPNDNTYPNLETSELESSSALDFVNHSISSVSRALHDSITTPLLRRLSFESDYTRSETSSHGQIAPSESKEVEASKEIESKEIETNEAGQESAIPDHTESTKKDVTAEMLKGTGNEGNGNGLNSPLNFVHHSFATVSRVLQENIMASFQHKPTSADSEKLNEDFVAKQEAEPVTSAFRKDDNLQDATEEIVKTTVTDMDPKSSADDVSATSADRRTRLGFATVAGGIAGGVAGLFIAGPAGAVIGAKCAQTAGVLGVLLEGSVQIGVFVAGVAAAKYTAQQIQQMEEKRFLTIGEAGSRREVLLVRPNVVVDPIWDEICVSARKSAPIHNTGGPHFLPFKLFPKAEEKEAALAKRERYHRDSDIVQTDEEELPTADKILLLVSRILNDKSSLPGYVYRYLIKEFKERGRKEALITMGGNVDDENGTNSPNDMDSEKAVVTHTSTRGRRQDAHAVIKHLTATLIDVRPGFATSPTMTELTAAAVEGLVFGELYDLVFEEIVKEESDADQRLQEKIRVFENSFTAEGSMGESLSHLSQSALRTLQRLPQAHSAVDKLRICVQFLDVIAQHFATSPSTEAHMGADSLLKMACQHIVAAKVPNLNAEVAFLEEFARDEQLLRGREGYALVTLQASTHFLNLSDNLGDDIFAEVEVIEA